MIVLDHQGQVLQRQPWQTSKEYVKNGNKTVPANYRPNALNIQLIKYVVDNFNIINDRPVSDIYASLATCHLTYNDEEFRSAALDIPKAFDQVCHEDLLNKLLDYDLSNKLCL